ncbi:MAG: NUDIX hydrolase [Nitrospirae bacterium]|nr:NUDIX hydrolase [Nitrospirota bacterium]
MPEVIEKNLLWHGNFLKCVSVTYRNSSGLLRNWEVAERVDCDGVVAIVPVTENGDVLLIRQFRPAVNKYVIEFPAGLNDKGEALEDAARRELREETGYLTKELTFLVQGPLSSGLSSEILTVYLAKGLEMADFKQQDETEDIEVLRIPIGDLSGKLSLLEAAGNFIDLKIFGLIELAKKHF